MWHRRQTNPFHTNDLNVSMFVKISIPELHIDYPLLCFFGIEGYVALDRNPAPGYNTLLL